MHFAEPGKSTQGIDLYLPLGVTVYILGEKSH